MFELLRYEYKVVKQVVELKLDQMCIYIVVIVNCPYVQLSSTLRSRCSTHMYSIITHLG